MRLGRIEAAQMANPRDAVLQYLAGVVCMRLSLWGKAQQMLKQFDQWLKEAIASKIPEPNAMTVATVASNLRPSTRVVLIKGYDERGITWFTNFESRRPRCGDRR